MASVHHLFSDAHFIPLEIIKRYRRSAAKEKEIYFAAVRIQRTFRGYLVRKEVKRWHKAATVIQKVVRGWLVRWRLPEIYAELLDIRYKRYYNQMATRIQANWKGYIFRKHNFDVKEARRQRETIEKTNEEMQKKVREMFEAMRRDQKEEECKKEVGFILYKLHHLLRTHQLEGIYSLHGKTKLSAIEMLMRALPFTKCMKQLREVYNRECDKEVRRYVFSNKKLQKMEDLYKLRNKELDVKEPTQRQPHTTRSKEFVLTKKIEGRPYERMVTALGAYPTPEFVIRQPEPWNNISRSDFKIYDKKLGKIKPKYPPYYIDFWTKTCPLHNPPSCLD